MMNDVEIYGDIDDDNDDMRIGTERDGWQIYCDILSQKVHSRNLAIILAENQ